MCKKEKQLIPLDNNTLMISGIGPKSEMQDAGIYNLDYDGNNCKWFIVCDGIGGQPYGAEAAKLACQVVDTFIKKSRLSKKAFFSGSYSSALILNLQQEFRKSILSNKDLHDMGCTLCLLIIIKELGFVCWSGDSKLYQIRDQKCYWETTPHTWVFDLHKKGILTLDESRISARNELTGSINGYTHNIRFETKIIDISTGDALVLCTDGVWSALEHDELMQVLFNPNNEAVIYLEEYLQKYASDNYFGYFLKVGVF